MLNSHKVAETDPDVLSVRESQLLKLAASGFTDVAIAHKLGISEATVKTYWRRIRMKIGPYSRTELVATVLKSEMGRTVSELRERSMQQLDGLPAQFSFYQQLVENAPDAILIVTMEGVVQLANEAAAAMFGWKKEELKGRHISVLVPERHRDIHFQHLQEYISAPSRREMGDHMATSAVDKNGHEFPIAASLATIGEDKDMKVICIVRSLRWKK